MTTPTFQSSPKASMLLYFYISITIIPHPLVKSIVVSPSMNLYAMYVL